MASLVFTLPGSLTQAAAKYGQVTAKWAKSGNYSFQLKKNGTLVYKVGSGKETNIAKKVVSARFHGTKVAYIKAGSYDSAAINYTAPFVIYNCAARKAEKSAKILCRWTKPYRVAGFYGDTIVVHAQAGEASGMWSVDWAKKQLKNTSELCFSDCHQAGKSLVFLDYNEDKGFMALKVLDMSTGKVNVISKKGYAVLVQNAKLYYAEVAMNGEGDIKKQNIRIYTCSLKGTGKKLLGTYRLDSKCFYDYTADDADLRIIPTKTAVFVSTYKNDRPFYQTMSYSTKKLKTSNVSALKKKAKLSGLVAATVTSVYGE